MISKEEWIKMALVVLLILIVLTWSPMLAILLMNVSIVLYCIISVSLNNFFLMNYILILVYSTGLFIILGVMSMMNLSVLEILGPSVFLSGLAIFWLDITTWKEFTNHSSMEMIVHPVFMAILVLGFLIILVSVNLLFLNSQSIRML